MRRLKKNIFLTLCASVFGLLAIVRYMVLRPQSEPSPVMESTPVADSVCSKIAPADSASCPTKRRSSLPHPIRSVPSYNLAFPDVQDVQILAARHWGVRPVRDRRQAEERKSELVFVGCNPFYDIDPSMHSSIPYLVPHASILLHDIGRNFLDSLYVKGVPLHKIIVSSVLRTEDDVARLLRRNGNASEQSCHRFGTTFDIAYNRYTTVSPPDGAPRRTVQNDTLKWVLSEVLRDLRQEGRCYIKHEIKQGCFHITVR
ncbi:MAG: DUF5715 family protein [Bacteroidaceae bacterium]|nr:DUF5715 family protein [Bacteroidaceae bacterium]